ncbi:ATP-binding protein [Kaarinaea lacus]
MQIKSNFDVIKNAPSKITAGFVVFTSLIALLMILWVNSIAENKELMQEVAGESVESNRISKMINAVHMQAMAIQQLKRATTPEDRAEAYLRFHGFGITFSSISHLLLSNKMEPREEVIWKKISSHVDKFDHIIEEADVLFNSNKLEEAYALLIEQSDFIENQLMSSVARLLSDELLEESQNEVNNIIENASATNDTTYVLLFFLAWITFFLGAFMLSLIKRTVQSESTALEQGERLKDLYAATSISGISLDQKIDETLKLGCRVLGMEIGKLGQQDPVMNTSTFLNTIAPAELPAKRGLVLPLDKTFCNVTFSSDGPIAMHHVSESKYKDHPAAAFLGMEAYIGTTIFVNDKKYGTVNFSNRKPRSNPFTKADIDFVNILGKWISITIEQQITENALEKAKIEAETANHAKSTFLANMSHEIRTPLTAILGYSEMLLEEGDEISAEEREHEINSIIKSGSHLQTIINDILDLSKIEAGQLVFENSEIETTSFIDEVITIFKTQARDKNLEFSANYEFPLPNKIIADPTRLKQILINLCGNAIKFTQDGSVTINVGFMEEENQLSISIEDTGIGMTEDERQVIFKPFSQADDSITRKFGGTGLGLCISKQLAQKMGGDVKVESNKDQGSTFTVTIDVGMSQNELLLINEKSTAAKIRTEPFHLPHDLSGHVLLVEDTVENQKIISKYLIKTGLTVDIADNGKIAIDMAKENNYDLMLMDIQMPVMDGLEATRRLRKDGFGMPIICVTANAMIEDRERCFQSGADDYLTKPLKLSHFYSVLKRHLNQQETEEKLITMPLRAGQQ